MCGIFGVVFSPSQTSRLEDSQIEKICEELFLLSERRGREAAGLILRSKRGLHIYKEAGTPSQFIQRKAYKEFFTNALNDLKEDLSEGLTIMGHSRLVTNGVQTRNENNQPVVVKGAVGIHNGILTNESELLHAHPKITKEYDVDTEVLLKTLTEHFASSGFLGDALQKTYAQMEGSASLAVLFEKLSGVSLSTNTGSLYFAKAASNDLVIFLSEKFILERMCEFQAWTGERFEISHLAAGESAFIEFDSLEIQKESFRQSRPGKAADLKREVTIFDHSFNLKDIHRCKKCILPYTHPVTYFDADGVCNHCRGWKKITVSGEEALMRAVEPYRKHDGSPDVIVAFSGGRDSAYGLHYVKKTLGMNPVAFTYDWGLVTDLARRNQARICGKLGVEHILRAADIPTKRRYVRKNIEAWLKRPELGMVTLFTAGDKEFYHHARQLKNELDIKLVIFCTGNMIEDTPYKTGFCGFQEADHKMTLTRLSPRDKARLSFYYMKQYALNPAYLNESLKDTLMAFWHTFIRKDDFLYLYHYLHWDEETIVGTIRREYNWEVATDTTTTWRIGDGTAPFYNYIYTVMAGFSEDDVMLSNMVREGILSREEALKKGAEFRLPRWESLREYSTIVGFNLEEAMNIINAAPKLYETRNPVFI